MTCCCSSWWCPASDWALEAAALQEELIAAGRAAYVRTEAGELWFAAENLRSIEALYPGAEIAPR